MGSEAEHPAGLYTHTAAFHIGDKMAPPRQEDISMMSGFHSGTPSHESTAPNEQVQCGHLPSKPHGLVSAESSAIRFEQAPFNIVSKLSIGAFINIADPNAKPKAQKSAGLADDVQMHFEPRPTRFRVASSRHTSSRAVISKPPGKKSTPRVSMHTVAAPQPELAQLPERPASKTCRRCSLVKPAAAFQIDRHNADGMQSYCRECKALRARERRTERVMAPDDEDVLKLPPTGHTLATGLGGSSAVAASGNLLQCVTATLPIVAKASSQVPAAEACFGSASSGNSDGDSAKMLDFGTHRDSMASGIVATASAALAGAVPSRRRRKGCNPQSSERPGIGPGHSMPKRAQNLVEGVVFGGKVAIAAVSKGNKCCRKCRQVLALSNFHKNCTTSDGHQLYCKYCQTQALQPSKKAWQADGQGALASETVVEEPPLELPQQRLSGLRPQQPKTLMRFHDDDDDDEPLTDFTGAALPAKKMRTHPVKRKEREGGVKVDSAASLQLPVAGSARDSHSKGPGGASARDDTASAKKCRRCQVIKPAAQFWRNRSTVDGLQWFCKVCQSMACAAPASRPSHEGKEWGHPHAAQAGKGTSNGRAVTGSQSQEVVPTSELSSSARQAAQVVVPGSQQDMQRKCGLQALADAATGVDLQRTTLLAAFELTIGFSQSQQQQQQLATAQLPASSTALRMIDPPTVPAVLPVATIGANAVREGADRPPSHSTTIQSSSPAPTGQPPWQLSAWQLGGSACTVTSAHFREDVSPQHASPGLGASGRPVAVTTKLPDYEDSRRSLNGWLPGNTRFVGTPMGQSQVYRWLPSLAGRQQQQQHQNPLDAAMAAIKRQRVLSAEMGSRHGAVGAGRSAGLFFDPSSGKTQQQLLHSNGESYSNRESTLLQHSWAGSHL